MNSSLHFFNITALSPQPAQQELNLFVQQNRVVAVEKQWGADGGASFWSVCLTVVDGAGPLPAVLRAANSQQDKKGAKIDYREVLNEKDFAVYAEMRNLRASLAQPEATRQPLRQPGFPVCSELNGRCNGVDSLFLQRGYEPNRCPVASSRLLKLQGSQGAGRQPPNAPWVAALLRIRTPHV